MARWDEETGRTSAAFARWRLVERDQRAFLRIGLRFSQERYAALWEEAGRRPAPGRGDRLTAFDELVDGLRQDDHEWMLAAAVLQDAIDGHARYAAQAWREASGAGGWEATPPGADARAAGADQALPDAAPAAPAWETLRARFEDRLDVRIEPDAVRRVRRLGQVLRDRRAELRSEQQRRSLPPGTGQELAAAAALDAHAVLDAMDALARAVLAADPVVLAHAEGRRRAP